MSSHVDERVLRNPPYWICSLRCNELLAARNSLPKDIGTSQNALRNPPFWEEKTFTEKSTAVLYLLSTHSMVYISAFYVYYFYYVFSKPQGEIGLRDWFAMHPSPHIYYNTLRNETGGGGGVVTHLSLRTSVTSRENIIKMLSVHKTIALLHH